MGNFQEKNKVKSILYYRPFLFVFAFILIFFIWGVVRFLVKMNETEKNRKIAQMKVEELQKSREKLVTDIDNLKTDKGLEENIREKFGLAKEGEGLIVVVDDKKNLDEQKDTEGNWLSSFFGNLFK